jgi:hypothetical protein
VENRLLLHESSVLLRSEKITSQRFFRGAKGDFHENCCKGQKCTKNLFLILMLRAAQMVPRPKATVGPGYGLGQDVKEQRLEHGLQGLSASRWHKPFLFLRRHPQTYTFWIELQEKFLDTGWRRGGLSQSERIGQGPSVFQNGLMVEAAVVRSTAA